MNALRPRLPFLLPALFLLAAVPSALAAPAPQASAAPAATPGVSTQDLQPALSQVANAIASVRIDRWHASSKIRSVTQDNASSITRDLGGALPALMAQAQAAPGQLAPAFAVYRNIDALYDVLLRVAETSSWAAPSSEARGLDQARAALESARSRLGNALLQSLSGHDAEIARLRSGAQAQAAAPPAPPKKIVVDDGPEPASKHRRKKPVSTQTPRP